METINYIIPICDLGDESYAYRMSNINYIYNNFLSVQENVKVNVIYVHQLINNESAYGINIPGVKSIVVKYPIFNKGWLYNIGANVAEGDHIFLAESDVCVLKNKNYFRNVLDFIKKEKLKWCFGYNVIHYLNRIAHAQLLLKNKIVGRHRKYLVKQCGIEGGIVYVNRNFYYDIGGMNECLQGLGAIDNEFVVRAQHASKTYEKYLGQLYHLYHPISPLKELKKNYREINSKIYKEVKSNPEDAIKFLNSLIKANMEKPVSHDTKFLTKKGEVL